MKKTIKIKFKAAPNSVPVDAEIEIDIQPEDFGLPTLEGLANGEYSLVVTDGVAAWVAKV